MDKRRFHNACRILMNIDKDELENAGIIARGAVGGSDWTRFNDEPLIFIAKLGDAQYDALWALIEVRQRQTVDSASRAWACIEILREEEANSVEILCDNPEGPPNAAVVCTGNWTDWNERRFEGENVFLALEAAVAAFTTSKVSPEASHG